MRPDPFSLSSETRTASRRGDHPARPSPHLVTRRSRAAAPGVDPDTYFLVLECVRRISAHDLAARVPDADAVADIALRRVENGLPTVASPDRRDAWVSVVCRNAYLNFIRARRNHRTIEDTDAVHDPQAGMDRLHDAPIIRDALAEAIDRLPRFLREVAILRFAEGWAHAAIARKTGKELPIVRAYASRAAMRLRNDTRLAGLLQEWRG